MSQPVEENRRSLKEAEVSYQEEDFYRGAAATTHTPTIGVHSESTDQQSTRTGIILGVPAFNEEVAIGSTVLTSYRYVDEVVVIDDGSSDRTSEIAEAAGATVLQHGTNKGKGRAIRTYLEYIGETEFEAAVLLDGDGQHDPANIPHVIKPILDSDADIVIGSRYLEANTDSETPRYRRIGQQALDFLTFGSSGMNYSDTQSGFRAFSPSAVESLEIRTDGMGVESEMIHDAAEKDLVINEQPIDVRYKGIDGQTFNPLQHGLSVATFILMLIRDKHPLLFFGLPGLLLTNIGVFIGIDGILIYQNTGIFYPAKAMIAGFTTIIGILGIFSALLLNSVSNMITNSKEVSK